MNRPKPIIAVDVTCRVTLEELRAALSPAQLTAFLQGLACVLAAPRPQVERPPTACPDLIIPESPS